MHIYTAWWSGNTNTNVFVKILNIVYIRSSQPDRIRIMNIFVPPNLTKYEYQIYSFLATWQNTNIRNKKMEYLYSMANIRISEYIRVTLVNGRRP